MDKQPDLPTRRPLIVWFDPDALESSESCRCLFLLAVGAVFIALAFLFDTPADIWRGSLKILTSPANLLTDYFQLANVGATLLNAGLMTVTSLLLVHRSGIKVNGAIIAAIFTVAGFSFFGKNLYNSQPIVLGVFLYARMARLPFNRFMLQALFGTSLAPLVSEITFNLSLPFPWNWLLGIAAGVAAGWLLPPLSMHFIRFHQGFNLYNVGFTAGIVGMFFLAVLKSFGIQVITVSILSSGNNAAFAAILGSLFLAMLIFGLVVCRWKPTGLRQLLAQPGKLVTDFVILSGFGLTLINMASLGFIATIYVLLVGGELNGPVIGGILTVVGFGAFGKHLRNTIPILIGVYLANFLNIYDRTSTVAVIGALFGTTLAPIAGQFGVFWGALAGFLHMALVSNVHFLHGGMNLYNNGFSGGFIAAGIVPLIEFIREFWKGSVSKNGS